MFRVLALRQSDSNSTKKELEQYPSPQIRATVVRHYRKLPLLKQINVKLLKIQSI